MKHRILTAILASSLIAGSVSFAASTSATDAPLIPKALSPLVWDESLAYIKGIAEGDTASSLAEGFDGALTVTDPAGNDLGTDDPVGTDYVFTVGQSSAKVLLYGDVNRDAKVNAKDVSQMVKKSAGNTVDLNETACDVTLDGSFNMKDAAQMLKKLAGWQVELGYIGWGADMSPVPIPDDDPSLMLYFTDSVTKDSPNVPNITENASYYMELARNEAESCTLNFYSLFGHDGLHLSWTDFTDKCGNTLDTTVLWEDYMIIANQSDFLVPDRLPPVEETFSVEGNKCQAVFVKASAKEDTPAGLYRSKIDVTDETGTVIKSAYVYAEVWDFAIPYASTNPTMIGMGNYAICAAHPSVKTAEEQRALYERYYEYMLNNRLCPWCLPYNPSDSRADKWMDDPRVNTFIVSGGYEGEVYQNLSAEEITKVHEHIKDNPEWMKKAIFYLNDEPYTHDLLMEVLPNEELVNSVWENARTIVPIHVAFQYDDGDSLQILYEHTTVMCLATRIMPLPTQKWMDGETWYTEEATERYGTLLDRMEEWKANGREVWSYDAGSDIDQEDSGMFERLRFWHQYNYNTEGYLYYESTGWGNTEFRTGHNQDGERGILVYCGEGYGIQGPIACLRCEISRDSQEDYEYFRLIEAKYGRETALEYLNRLVTDIVTYENDFALLTETRRDMAKAIMAK